MTQPDLVSKLRELITLKCEYRDKMRTGSNWLASEQSKEMAELQIQMTERFIGELESLLGLEGQAAPRADTDRVTIFAEVGRNGQHSGFIHLSVKNGDTGERHDFVLPDWAVQPSPSTPIVPGTAGLSAAKVQTWANNCAVYEEQNRVEDQKLAAEYHRGAKEAFQRVAEALKTSPTAIPPKGASDAK